MTAFYTIGSTTLTKLVPERRLIVNDRSKAGLGYVFIGDDHTKEISEKFSNEGIDLGPTSSTGTVSSLLDGFNP